ncbi:DUF6205 family protein [Streptomyces sp. NPDC092296]|uniref:DUF6205 family protein n=1 Tax=Streptomyces sp. NPDC092296 TaxID=3366012 RepID=UPI003818FE66
MGYNTSVDGEISITPPLAWSEFKDSPFAKTRTDSKHEVRLRIIEETVDTDEGQLTRRTADALLPISGDAFKAYHLVEHVQQAIDAFPGHEFAGRFECEGENAGDLWRVVIRVGVAVKVEPRIVWPDDDAQS